MDFLLVFVRGFLLVLDILQWVVLIWVLLSWILFSFSATRFRWRHRQFYGTLETLNDLFERMTRPFLRPIRRLLRRFDTAGIDWSPMVLVLIIWLVRQLVFVLLQRLILTR
jgi:uncharacterized protein YggT (Ycf19 family)